MKSMNNTILYESARKYKAMDKAKIDSIEQYLGKDWIDSDSFKKSEKKKAIVRKIKMK